MRNMNDVLDEVGTLIQQIDVVTERIESRCEPPVNHVDVALDNNRNLCGVTVTPAPTHGSRNPLPSPYLDYTFLNLSNECNTCVDNIGSLTYNVNYPLWIQHDSWTTKTSISEISEVSTGTASFSNPDDTSLQSLSNAKNVYRQMQEKKQLCENNNKIRECCVVSSKDFELNSGTYCGVYEHMMEEKLEDLVWNETGSDDSDSEDFSEMSESSKSDSFELPTPPDDYMFSFSNLST